ncbi:tRNA 4-thiouridine(8) synthase ThiI, partial [Citrobacter sp. TBCS-11]
PSPKTNPKLENCIQYEKRMDVEGMVDRAVKGIMLTTIAGENWDQTEEEEFADFL